MSITDKLNTPAVQQPANFPTMLKQQQVRLKNIAPEGISITKLSSAIMAQFRANPKLAQCDPMSIMGAFIQAAQLGLEASDQLGLCYFIPYKNQCTLQLGYKGMIELAYRSGKVKSIAARVVNANDVFKYSYGIDDVLEHTPAIADRGEMIGVYAIAKLVGGGVHFEVLSKEDVEKTRKASRAGTSTPWREHFEEMAKKTAIRRLFKYLPVGTDLNRAIAIDERATAGIQDNKEAAKSVLEGDFDVMEGGFDAN